jgi:MFS family permease
VVDVPDPLPIAARPPVRRVGLDRALVLVVVAAALVAGARALLPAGGAMDGMEGTGGPGLHTIGSMPLAQMPEMFVGFAALAGLAMLSPKVARRSVPPGGTSSPRRASPWQVAALTAALVVDTSKTATLGFVIPGLRAEYGLTTVQGSLLAVAGLTGTTIGATAVRAAGTRVERGRVFLLAALGFALTSCCAMMPTFTGNLVMCLLMGVTVGGLAPLLIAAIRDCGDARTGAGLVVLTSVLATAAGFLLAASAAALLEPVFGWRVLWLIGIPTGMALIPLSRWLEEPGRAAADPATVAPTDPVPPALAPRPGVVRTRVQYAFAFVTGLTAFGLSVWTPTLVSRSGVVAPQLVLIGVSLVLVLASVVLAAVVHRRGSRAALVATASLTGAALVGVALVGSAGWSAVAVLAALVVALFGANAMGAIALPIAADTRVAGARTRFTAEVSIWNRVGGLLGPPLIAVLVISPGRVLVAITVLGLACCGVALVSLVRGRAPARVHEPVAGAGDRVSG